MLHRPDRELFPGNSRYFYMKTVSNVIPKRLPGLMLSIAVNVLRQFATLGRDELLSNLTLVILQMSYSELL